MSKIGYHRQENLVNYKARYLDYLAALFHLHGPCAAVIEFNKQLYLSYNSDPKVSTLKSVNFIDKILSNIKEYSSENLLGIYLTFNLDFVDLVKKTRNHVDNLISDLLDEFIKIRAENNIALTNTKIIGKALTLETSEFGILYTSSLVTKYQEILGGFEKTKDTKQLELFLRPLQDSIKLYYSFNNGVKYYGIKDILPNPYNLHTERNIADHFPSVILLDPNYIGISRLSCGYCHKYFEETKHGHRGTHGVCDEEWKLIGSKISPQDQIFKDSVKPIMEFNQKNPPMQHRRLSTDDFEKDIPFFTRDQNLFNFKSSLNLIDKELSFDSLASDKDDVGYNTDTVLPIGVSN